MSGAVERPLRVLFVTNYVQTRQTIAFAGIFAERRARSLREAGVDVVPFDIGNSSSPAALLRAWRALRAEIRRTRPDLLHAQYGTVTALAAVLTMHPTVITFGGGDLQPGDYHSGSPGGGRNAPVAVSWLRAHFAVALSNVAALFARRTICVSERLRRALWWRKKRAVVIPDGVDTSFFSPGPRDEARAALGWDGQARIVLTDGGRDWKTKGLDFVEAAMEIARRTLPDLELHIIRDVPPERMPLLYRAADVLVCASRREGSPNVVKEALACALPIVGVPVGDVEERLRGVTPSLLVERTPEALAAGIVELTRQPRRSNGPDAVAEVSLQRVAEKVQAVYRQIAARRNG